MSSINDTFNSKKTTPFERRGVPREATFDVDTSEFYALGSELGTESSKPIRWLVAIACGGALVGAVMWGTGIGF